MRATESVGDSEKMTELWRSEAGGGGRKQGRGVKRRAKGLCLLKGFG